MEKREANNDIERRTHTVEMRVKDPAYGSKTPVMSGYAANFNSLSEDLGGFREVLMPGCFKEALGHSDVRGLFNHNPDKILGRNASGTLRLTEDERGLHFEIDPPETSYAKDLGVSMRRGDVTQCSFGFKVASGGDSWAEDSAGMWIRTITKVEQLFDVSPVTYPAYPSTSCSVRSFLKQKGDDDINAKLEAEKAKEEERKAQEEYEKDMLNIKNLI